MLNNVSKALVILASVGMLITAYLIYQHYKPVNGSFCNLSDFVNCDVVNKSEYSEIFDIPVAVFGFLAYTTLFVVPLGILKKWFRPTRELLLGGVIFSLFSLFFSLYLTAIELFVLRTICLLCVTQQILIFIITLLLIQLWFKQNSELVSQSQL